MSASGPRYQDPLETWSEKFTRKFKENPWVPLGCLATCGALVMSAYKMRAGKSKDMNYWLRARVVLQGVTILALVGGSMAIQKSRNAQISDMGIGEDEGGLPRNEATTELGREKKKSQEKQEFEERLKEAQATTEMEEGAGFGGLMTVRGPTVHRERRDEERKKQSLDQQAHPTAAVPTTSTSDTVKRSNGWRWWTRSKGSDPSADTDSKS